MAATVNSNSGLLVVHQGASACSLYVNIEHNCISFKGNPVSVREALFAGVVEELQHLVIV